MTSLCLQLYVLNLLPLQGCAHTTGICLNLPKYFVKHTADAYPVSFRKQREYAQQVLLSLSYLKLGLVGSAHECDAFGVIEYTPKVGFGIISCVRGEWPPCRLSCQSYG